MNKQSILRFFSWLGEAAGKANGNPVREQCHADTPIAGKNHPQKRTIRQWDHDTKLTSDPAQAGITVAQPAAMATYKVSLVNASESLNRTIDCEDDQFILDAAADQSVDRPVSCRADSC